MYLEGFLVFFHQDAQVPQQLPHHFASVEQQTHDDETSHIPELLVRQNGVASHVLLEVVAQSDGFVEAVGLEEMAAVTRPQVVVVVQLTDAGRDFADLPTTAGKEILLLTKC